MDIERHNWPAQICRSNLLHKINDLVVNLGLTYAIFIAVSNSYPIICITFMTNIHEASRLQPVVLFLNDKNDIFLNFNDLFNGVNCN